MVARWLASRRTWVAHAWICLIQSAVCDGLIIVQFDGSLRPPRDPGFPSLPTKVASCSASITYDASPMMLGGRLLPMATDITAAHVEYEGLLLGLSWLAQQTSQDGVADTVSQQLLIRGDCKAVIDQLMGNSLPRKVQHLHAQCVACIEQIADKELNLPTQRVRITDVKYEHVLRHGNQLCDAVCGHIPEIVGQQSVVKFAKSLDRDLRFIVRQDDIKKKKKASTSSVAFPNHIVYSQRIHLYDRMIQAARQDASALVIIGEAMVHESKFILTQIPKRKQPRKVHEQLHRGMRYQIEGYGGLGLPRKVEALERKYKHEIRRYEREQGRSYDEVRHPPHVDSPQDEEAALQPKSELVKQNSFVMQWHEAALGIDFLDVNDEGVTVWESLTAGDVT